MAGEWSNMFSGNNMIIALIVVVLAIMMVLMFMASRRYKGVYHTNATPLYTDVPVTVTNGEVVPNTLKLKTPLGKITIVNVQASTDITKSSTVVTSNKDADVLVVISTKVTATGSEYETVHLTVYNKTPFPLEVSGGKANPAVNGNVLNPATHSVSGFRRMLVNDSDLTCTAWHSTKFAGALS